MADSVEQRVLSDGTVVLGVLASKFETYRHIVDG